MKKRKRKTKAQSTITPMVHNPKRKMIRALGFFLFLIGGFLIITSFFRVPITGNVISDDVITTASIGGILLEVIGIILMVLKLDKSEPKIENKNNK